MKRYSLSDLICPLSGEPLQIIDAHTHTRFDGEPERTSKIPVTQEQYLKEYFEKWKGENEQVDDVLVIGVRI